MRLKFLHAVLMLFLVFVAVDMVVIFLALKGVGIPLSSYTVVDGHVVVRASDLLVFVISVPVAFFLDYLWRKEKWSWFSDRPEIHRNIFAVFVIIYLILAFAIIFAGYGVCSSTCSSGINSCVVSYKPFQVDVIYGCKPIIGAQLP